MYVLHITPHMGGGVGAVVSAWISFDDKNTHKIISLDNSIQKNFDRHSVQLIYDGLFFSERYGGVLQEEVLKADVVVIHFWNHPLVYDLIFNRPIPKCRLVIWCHVSGLNNGAAIPRQVVEFADKFIFTSPASFESVDIENLPAGIKKKLDVVWSSSLDVCKKNRKKIKENGNIRIGYIGTADYAKLNKDFLAVVKSLKLKTMIAFYSNDSQDEIKTQASNMELLERISFNGCAKRKELPEIYKSIDILLYPLNPKHYGTCEQVLGEAMYYGCVPVVLNNKPESYIVKNRWNGIVAADIKEMSVCIEELRDNIKLRKKLSKNAIKSSCSLYSLKRIVNKWNHIFNKLMKVHKHIHGCGYSYINEAISPAELYAISQGAEAPLFYDYMNIQDLKSKAFIEKKIKDYFDSADIFKSKSKGSVLQYLQFFKDSKVLQEWGKLVEEVKADLQ